MRGTERDFTAEGTSLRHAVFDGRRLSLMLAVCATTTLAFSATAQAGLLTNIAQDRHGPDRPHTSSAQGVTGLLTGAQTSLVVGQAAVSGFQATLDPTIAGSITDLQASAAALAADAAALDPTAAQADVTAAVADLQARATGVLGSLSGVALTQALTNGLTIAQQVVSPICSIVGCPAALTAGVGVDLTRFYPLSTAIPVVDQTTNNLLTSTYDALYEAIVATVPAQLATLPAPVGSTAVDRLGAADTAEVQLDLDLLPAQRRHTDHQDDAGRCSTSRRRSMSTTAAASTCAAPRRWRSTPASPAARS